MPRYKVRMEETAYYVIEVEADDEDSAADAAEERFVQSENINEFFSYVGEREPIAIVLIDETPPPQQV